eukprot:scaffold15108_cov180-Amphora_coffeaeformis.AAC.64
MMEEAEALLHASATTNRVLKVILTLSLLLNLSVLEYGVVNAVIDNRFIEGKYWVAMLCDSASLTLPLHDLFSLKFLNTTILLSPTEEKTTWSLTNGAGVPVLKELRYLFPRYYFWCMVPYVEDAMEECPANNVIMLYLVLSTFTGLSVLFAILLVVRLGENAQRKHEASWHGDIMDKKEFRNLLAKIHGEVVLKRLRGAENDGQRRTTRIFIHP